MTGRRSVLLDVSPFRESRAFTLMWCGALVTGVGNALTAVAVGLHIYALTQSTFAVSMVGVTSLVPMMAAGLLGGTVVDAFDRRRVALWSAVLAWTSTLGIALLAWLGRETIYSLYLLSALSAVGATLVGAARNAMIPSLISARSLPAASALNGISMGVVITLGPTLAGLLVARFGFAPTYTVDVLLFCGSFVGLYALPPMRAQQGEEHRPGLRSLAGALTFLRRSPNVAMSFIVDIVAMTFGNPRSVFPAVGALALGGGPLTVGLLSAASAFGALVCSLFSGRIVHYRWHGRAVNQSIIAYGVFTAGLGIVVLLVLTGHWPGGAGTLARPNGTAIAVAMLMLFGCGAADNISSIFRNTILVQAVPDNLRGRLQGIFIMVVTGGPRLGDLFVGLTALGALWLPPLLGGLLIVVVLAALTRTVTSFQRYDALAPQP